MGISGHLAGHQIRTSSERAHVDDWILRVDVDVGHGGKVDLHTQLLALASHLTTVGIEQTIILYAAQHHVLGEGRQLLEPHSQPPLSIKGHQERHLAQLLGLVGQDGLIGQLSTREEQPTHMILLNDLMEQVAVGLVALGSYRIDEQLPHLLLEREFIHD